MLKETETEETIGFLSHFDYWWHFNWGGGGRAPYSYAYVQIPESIIDRNILIFLCKYNNLSVYCFVKTGKFVLSLAVLKFSQVFSLICFQFVLNFIGE